MKRWSKRAARQILFPLAEGAWAAAFALAGRLLRPHASLLTFTGRDRVLLLAPHPDDETLAAGGTLALHHAAGDQVCVVIVTDGSRSRAGGIDPATMRAARQLEATQALARLGALELVQWGLPEGAWAAEDLLARLVPLLHTLRPTLIYTPSCVDYHPEHRRVAAGVAAALTAWADGVCQAVRVYEVSVPLTPILVNRLADIGPTYAAKWHALQAYRSQRATFGSLPRHTRYLRALYRVPGPVEAFWELAPAAFVARMAQGAADPYPYRGLRLRPFSDGLAWLNGLKARKQLAKPESQKG